MSTTRRSYHQFCGLARALDLVGERWTLLLVRELLLGRQRYSQLLGALPGLTTNLLAARLKAMEQQGLVRAVSGEGYELTELGASLEPVIMELGRFGGRWLGTPRRGERVDLAWGLLSLKRRYRGGVDVTLALEVEGSWFTLRFEPEWLRVYRSRPDRCDATLHLSTDQARALFFAGAPLDEAQLDGDRTAARRALATLLPTPFAHQPAPPGSKTRWTSQVSDSP